MNAFLTQKNHEQSRFNDSLSCDDELENARRHLTGADSAAERVAAVQSLAQLPSDLTTASLVAALFDQNAGVRQAAIKALNQIPDSGISSESLEVLFGENARLPEPTEGSERSVEPKLSAEMSRDETLAKLAKDFDDDSPAVRKAAAIALHELAPDNAAKLFESLIESSARDRCERIADAIVDSGLVARAIDDLADRDRSRAQAALSFLFLIAKFERVEPLLDAVENHPSPQIRRALVKVLTLNGRSELAESAAKRRLGIPTPTANLSAYR